MGYKENGQIEDFKEEEIENLFVGIMEGYQDSIIPPLTDFLPLAINEKGSSSRKKARKEAAETECLQKERERREKMSEMFYHLQSLVPSLQGNKATREKIVTDTIAQIKFLEEEKERLEDLKESMLQESISEKCTNMINSSVIATASNAVAFFGIQLPNKRSMMTKIFRVFEKHQSEVLAASISVNEQQLLTLTATVVLGNNGGDTIEKIKREILIL